MAEQLALFQTQTAPKPTRTDWQQTEDGDRFFAKLRRERDAFNETASHLGLGELSGQPIARWPVDAINRCRLHLESQGILTPAPVAPTPNPTRLTPPAPYRPHSEDRKQRTRCTRLLKKYQQQYSLGTWWMDYVQADTAARPWYFGMCSLPSEGASVAPPYASQIVQRQAIAREHELRQAELEQWQPVT